MTTFKTFLIEARRSILIDEDEAIDVARTKCIDAMKEHDFFVARGMYRLAKSSLPEFIKVDPKSSKRQSANTSNEYTQLLSNLPEWNKFPRRDSSLICTTSGNIEYATDFGDPYIVLPYDGAKFGVCAKFDLWDSFSEVHELFRKTGQHEYGDNMSLFNIILRNLFTISGTDPRKADKTYHSLVDAINTASDYLQKLPPDGFLEQEEDDKKSAMFYAKKLYMEDKYYKMFDTVISGKETLFEYIRKVLHPAANKFQLTDYSSLSHIFKKSHEVWTDSECLMIIGTDFAPLHKVYKDFYKKVHGK